MNPNLGVLRTSLILASALCFSCSGDTDPLEDGGTAPGCTTNDDCAADQYCASGTCTPGTGNDCENDNECGPGMRCNIVSDCGATRCSGNTCEPKDCTSHEDCDGIFCDPETGKCREEPCNAVGGCPTGFRCDNESGNCVQTDDCTSDDDCIDPDICVSQLCGPPIPCTTSSSCSPELRCIGEVCRDPCPDTECPNLYQCDETTGECLQMCTRDEQCPDGYICVEGSFPFTCQPQECEGDTDCNQGAGETCEGEENGHGRCIVVVMCGPNDECPIGTSCDPNTGRCEPLPGCRTDRDCDPGEYCGEGGFCYPSVSCETDPCPTGFECVGDTCVPEVCRTDADCPVQGERCIGGACQVPPTPDFVTEVRIVTPAGVVRPGTTYQFIALALDQSGQVVPGVTFTWQSTVVAVATIDGTGLATGAAQAGSTSITASVDTGMATITSPGVDLVNLGPEPQASDVRVTVISLSSGNPVDGAIVELNGVFGTLTTTTTHGVAVVAGAAGSPVTVTVAHPLFDYVTVVGVSSRDILIPLPPVTKPSRAGGIRGDVDFSQISTTGALEISASGASVPSPISANGSDIFFGGDTFTVSLPQVGDIPVPAGITASVEIPVVGRIPIKDAFYSRATTGLRAAYSFGGQVSLTGSGIGLGDLNNLITAILPFFQTFEHTVRPTVPVLSIPTVEDTIDIDGDGDTSEFVPDWSNFPALSLTPDTQQSLRYQLTVSNLPFVSGGNANSLIVVSGVLLPGIGFVPLGLDGQSDSSGNGIVPVFTTKMAPLHGGLEEGDYAVLASAIRIDSGVPGPGSSRLYVTDSLPTNVDLGSGWLDSPLDATWSESLRQVGLPVLANADMYRISFASDEGKWLVYGEAPTSELMEIPLIPSGAIDRTMSATVTVDALDLTQGTNAAGLFDINAGGAIGMDRVTTGFSRAIVGR